MTSPTPPPGAADAHQNGANYGAANYGAANHGGGPPVEGQAAPVGPTSGETSRVPDPSPWAPGAATAHGDGPGRPPTGQPQQISGQEHPLGATAPWAGATWPAPQAPQRPSPSGAPPGGPGWGPPGSGNPWGTTAQPPLPSGGTPLGPLASPSAYPDPYRSPSPPRTTSRRRRTAAAAIAIALVSAGIGGTIGGLVADGGATTIVNSGVQRTGNGTPGTSPAADDTVAAAAQVILPSTVTIAHEAGAESGTGSGVIIRPDGHILTNNHVVAGPAGSSIMVVLADGRTLDASVVGTDPSSDLAVVKIDATNLPAATFGDSEALSIGELVVAVGSPLGLSGTVTSGIVSSVHRPVRTGDSADQNAVLDAIQTDAPINPGNSGGPLVNSNGEIVGVNSAIATVGGGMLGQQQAGNIGVGFAIPSNYAEQVATELIETGVARHPYLGVSAATEGGSVSGPVLVGSGAKIRDLVRGGPAEQAGLQPSDVVTKLGDRQVTDVDALIAAVRSHQIGETVTVTYQRDGRTETVNVTLAEQPR